MPWSVPRVLESPRLRLRPVEMNDADDVFAYASDPLVTHFMTWPTHETVEDSREWLRTAVAAWESGEGHLPWAITRKDGGRFLGTLGVTVEGHKVMAGYVLHQAFWSQGITTEALITVRDAAWQDPSVKRFWLFCDIENHASARVAEKAGLAFEGVLRSWMLHPRLDPEARDMRFYALARP